MLYLSDAEVASLIADDMEHVVGLMHQMFQVMANGDYVLGGRNNGSHGMRISVGQGADERIFLAMPGYLGGDFCMAGMKWHGPNVPVAGNDDDSYFVMILNDIKTGRPIASLRADTLTKYRTAAINALAAEVLCRKEPEILSIVGPGRITTLSVRYLLKRFSTIREIRIKGRGQTSLDRFKDIIHKCAPEIVLTVCSKVKDAVQGADLTIINTGFHFDSYGDMPMIRDTWIKRGSTLICSAFASFPDTMLLNDSIKVCDLYASYECYEEELGYPAYRTYGTIGNRFADLVVEGKLKKEDMIDFSHIVSQKVKISSEDGTPIIFVSNGLALEDIALASSVYRKALDQKVGLEVD